MLKFLERIDISRMKKLGVILLLFYLYLYYKSRKRKVKKFFKQTN